jgi:hypothetical protein
MQHSERQIKFVKDTEKVPLVFGGLNILHKHTHKIVTPGSGYFVTCTKAGICAKKIF